MKPALVASIPNPPPLPNSVNCPGYDQPGYLRLMRSLSETDRKCVEASFKTISLKKLNAFVDIVDSGHFHIYRIEKDMYTTNVMALLALQKGLLSVNQVATMLFCDAAISTFVTKKCSYTYYNYVENGEALQYTRLAVEPYDESHLLHIMSKDYHYLGLPKDITKKEAVTIFGEEFAEPILQRFLGLGEVEWNMFCTEMEAKPTSEKKILINIVPEYGTWSPMVSQINVIMPYTFQSQYVVKRLNSGKLLKEKVMITPSFSMYQAFLDVMSIKRNRRKIELVPTYGILDNSDYINLKVNHQLAVSLYLPEKDPTVAYNYSNVKFKQKIDGWLFEGTLAVIIHDIYHAIKELWFSDSISLVRLFLAEIARSCGDRETCEKLVDGEVLDYPGASFSNFFSKIKTSGSIKKAMIQFMFDERLTLAKDYKVGRNDLGKNDRKVYDKFFLDSMQRTTSKTAQIDNYEPIKILDCKCFQRKEGKELHGCDNVTDPSSKIYFSVYFERGVVGESVFFDVEHEETGLKTKCYEFKLEKPMCEPLDDKSQKIKVLFRPFRAIRKLYREEAFWPHGEYRLNIYTSSGIVESFCFRVLSPLSCKQNKDEFLIYPTPIS